jgi:hypothetical protein
MVLIVQKTKIFSKILLLILLLAQASCYKSSNEMLFIMQSGDIKKSCAMIEHEIVDISDMDIEKLKKKRKLKVVKNTGLFVIALPTIFTSLLFADFSGDEKELINIYNKRIVFLQRLQKNQGCKILQNNLT